MSATRLGSLLSKSIHFCFQYWKPILIAAVVLGLANAVASVALKKQAQVHVGGMMQEIGIDADQLEEATRRMQAGDQEAAARVMEDVGRQMEAGFGHMGAMQDSELNQWMQGWTIGFMKKVFPAIGVSVLVSLLLTLLAEIFFLILVITRERDAVRAAKAVLALLLPMLGVWIWVFLRSFIWIPIIGFIPAIILFPRFVLAPVILVEEKKGIAESVRLSMKRTSGYWAKIVGNMIVVMLCMMLAAILGSMVTGIVSAFWGFLGLAVSMIWFQILTSFRVAFAVELAHTIAANPLTK